MTQNTRALAGVLAILAVSIVAYQTRVRPAQRDALAGADATPGAAAQDGPVPLYDDLGRYTRPVTARTDAQRYFDQGLRLTYAFNHAEAIRSFRRAAELDRDCAMCYWGIAYAYGPNINAPMDSASGVAAWRAVQQARAARGASAVERALIDALAQRYLEAPPADRAALDRAYADAMQEVRRRFPNDHDVLVLHAEAVMDLSPWDYWTREKTPRPRMAQVITDLERVLAENPEHPGACHYYIHAVEAAYPERAVACAERLAALMPGAGHIVHMPAHIYIRVGRWADAIEANRHAVHADEQFIADQQPRGFYAIGYYPHNYHFLSFAATMAGRSAQAIEAARGVSRTITYDIAREAPVVEPLVPWTHLTLVTFGRWQDVLREPLPPADLRQATALTAYARGVAQAATGDVSAARASLDTVRAILAAAADPINRAVLEIARHALLGEIAQRSGELRSAEQHFREAIRIEDSLLYMEPPHWYYPIRHSLGRVLLEQGRAAEAERIYREDLESFPENTWSLHGLAASLRAQGRNADADDVARRIARLSGDVELRYSRL